MSNGVYLAGTLQNKAGTQIDEENFYENFEKDPSYLRVEDKLMPYVSRGAFKLKQAQENFALDFNQKIVLDIGASTGGFTDFSLQNGAEKIYAIDVGKGQLDYKLRNNDRVVNLEETNFRHIGPDIFKEKIDAVVIDVSFISLVTIIKKLYELKTSLAQDFFIVALIKPQFEAGKEIMDKCKGVIKDEKIRVSVLNKTLEKLREIGFKLSEPIESPIKGAKGNIEFLVLITSC